MNKLIYCCTAAATALLVEGESQTVDRAQSAPVKIKITDIKAVRSHEDRRVRWKVAASVVHSEIKQLPVSTEITLLVHSVVLKFGRSKEELLGDIAWIEMRASADKRVLQDRDFSVTEAEPRK